MEGREWDGRAQVEFQIRLIQERLYGFGNKQFYGGLSRRDIALLEDTAERIPYEEAKRIFRRKNYEDPSMRGRTSFKPLQKLGFAALPGNCLRVTEAGEALLAEKDDYGEIFLRMLLKWEIPNVLDRNGFPPKYGYNIKPFVGFLRLIDAVNKLYRKNGMKAKGLSFAEVMGFGLTLIDYREIDKTARDIVNLRKQAAKVPAIERDSFTIGEIERLRGRYNLRHTRDYADNAIRYFRLTKYVRVGEWGKYVNLEPLRKNEFSSLFSRDDARPDFYMRDEYAAFMASAETPDLPGETKPELLKTVDFLAKEIIKLGGARKKRDIAGMSAAKLKKLRGELRAEMLRLTDEKEKAKLRIPQEVNACISELENLPKKSDGMPMSVRLEWLTARGLAILNDAEEIRPNYAVGDDGLPSGNALPGKADIECYYGDFVSICEVTLHRDSKQWIHEAQPVMRHLREFGEANKGKTTYCLFIAPQLHRDTVNMFHLCAQGGYEGERQRLAPMTVKQFSGILRFAESRAQDNNPVTRRDIQALFNRLADSVEHLTTSEKWREQAGKIIEEWKQA